MYRWFCIMLAVATIAFASRPAHAAQPGFAFLEIPTGARASALGGAYTSVARGVDAAFWNPAGLEAVHGVEVMGGHYELFQKLRHDHFAVAGRLMGWGLSGSLRALYSEAIPERDDLGNLIGTFGANDLEFGLGAGRKIGTGLALGLSGQVIHERIANSGATTYGFGLGGSWEPSSVSGLRLALSGQNLGPSTRYRIDGADGAPVTLPAAIQAGGSYARDVGEHFNLRGALETRIARGRNAIGLVGAELSSSSGAALRLGLRVNDTGSNFSMGAGYAVRSLQLDYAFVPMRLDLGDTHRISFATRF